MKSTRLRRGHALKEVLVGVCFMGLLVGCIGLVMFLLLHTDWWPIFSVLLSIPVGYGLALAIFVFGGAFVRSLFASEAQATTSESAPHPEWPSRLPTLPNPNQPSADAGDSQSQQHN